MSTTVVVARAFRGQTLYLTSAERGAFCWSCFKDRAMPLSVAVATRIITEAQAYNADAYALDSDGEIIVPAASRAGVRHFERDQCVVCGGPAPSASRCTNRRCLRCHRTHCTPGGSTSPGHNPIGVDVNGGPL